MPANNHIRAFSMLITALTLLAACAMQSTPVPAMIERIASADLSTVLQQAEKAATSVGRDNVLVVLDIDNTLLAMEQDLGSDQWYEWQKELQQQDQCGQQLVSNRLASAGALYYASAMRPTQKDAADIVRNIQNDGFTVFALTSRGPDFRLPTFRELRRNSFQFRDSAPGPLGGYTEIYMPEGGVRFVRYEDGVLMTSGQHKGDMLASLLAKTSYPTPKAVIVVDDNAKNLDAYGEYALKENINLSSVLYIGEEKVLAEFDAVKAQRQWLAVRDSLKTLQAEFGPDHYTLPEADVPEGCPAPE